MVNHLAQFTVPGDQCYGSFGEMDVAWSQLASMKVFIPAKCTPTLEILDLTTSDGHCPQICKNTFHNARQLEKYLKDSAMGSIRYVSICQKNSWASLEVCQSMLQCMMENHNVMPELLSVWHFLEAMYPGFQRCAVIAYRYKRECRIAPADMIEEMTFVLKYPERNGRIDGADPWSIRQTGVYQKVNPWSKTSLWILLNPRQNTAANARIENLLKSQEIHSSLQWQPMLLGLIVFSVYFTNWRAFMEFSEKEEMRMSAVVSTAVLDEKLRFSHSMLSELRCIEGRLLPLPSIFQSLVRNVHMLEAYNNDLQVDCSITSENHDSTQQILQNYVTMARAYSDNVTFLLDKIRGTAQLLSDTLNLKHQHTTQNISENTLALTTASVQDSATIRVITVVTLLYLPTTFIATVFGMQFFATGPTGYLTVASSQLWVFFVLATPFTAATFGFWKWMDRKQRQKGPPPYGSKATNNPEP